MSTVFLVCAECGKTFADCSDFYYCEGCGRDFCLHCKDAAEFELNEDKDCIISCKYCRNEDFDIETKYSFTLKKLNLTDSQVKELLRKENVK